MHRLASDNKTALPVLDYARPGLKSTLRRMTGFREFMIIAIIVAIALALAIARRGSLSLDNVHVILLGISVESIIAVAMTMLLVSGGFDLSVGSTLALSGMATAYLVGPSGWPIPLAIAVGLACGTTIGILNGLIVAVIGINPFVTTLAMMSIVRGLVMGLTRQNISGLPAHYKFIGQETFCGVQHPILIALAIVILGDLLLRKSRFFRQNYYIGGNEKAARLSGINVARLKVFNYALAGLLSAVAGVVMTARLDAASKTDGLGTELKVITAVIIGGASLQGGEGTVLGAFLGLLLMALINHALNVIGVDPSWQPLVIGATLLAAVMIDTLGKKMKA
jgi:ribose transport system permease protein